MKYVCLPAFVLWVLFFKPDDNEVTEAADWVRKLGILVDVDKFTQAFW